MNTNKNLTHRLTLDEQRAGGKKSGEARRKKKQMREVAELILSMNMKPGRGAILENVSNFTDIAGKNITVEEAIIVKQAQRAMKGDISAAVFLRETSGQNPEGNPDNSDILAKLDEILGGIDAIADD